MTLPELAQAQIEQGLWMQKVAAGLLIFLFISVFVLGAAAILWRAFKLSRPAAKPDLPDQSNEPRTPFRDVYYRAYGWTVTDDGYLAGLTAGDMGYEITNMRLVDFFVDAQVAEDKAELAKAGEDRNWPVHSITMDFITTLATANGIPEPTLTDIP